MVPILVLTVYLILFVFVFRPGAQIVEQFRRNCVQQMTTWLPLMSFWWLSLFVSDYFVRGWNELLNVYGSNKRFVMQKILCMMVYLLYVFLMFEILNSGIGVEQWVLALLLCETLAMGSLFILISYGLKNTGATILCLVAYSVHLNFFDSFGYFDILSIYPVDSMTDHEIKKKILLCFGMMIVSTPFWGMRLKKRS